MAIAVGQLYKYEGSRVLRQGSEFCNEFSQYDTSSLGRFAQDGKVSPAPFCMTLNKFTAAYNSSGEPTNFAAAVSYGPATADHSKSDTIKVNHPLRLEGDRVYLISHGYSPRITFTMPDGSVRTDTADFIPTDPGTLLSEGAFQELGKGTGNDLGIEALFAPNAVAQNGGPISSNSIVTSAGPAPVNPVLAVTIYTGDAGSTTHSVYSLDKTNLKQVGQANLALGQTVKLASGVSVTFDGYTQWAGLQVSHDPSQYYLLIAAASMVIGLIASLSIRRRRLWIRVAPGEFTDSGAPTVVTVGGLARSDSGNFSDEFAGWLERLRSCGPPVEPAREPVSAGKE